MPNFFRDHRGEWLECPRDWLRKSRDLEESIEDRLLRIMDEQDNGIDRDYWFNERTYR